MWLHFMATHTMPHIRAIRKEPPLTDQVSNRPEIRREQALVHPRRIAIRHAREEVADQPRLLLLRFRLLDLARRIFREKLEGLTIDAVTRDVALHQHIPQSVKQMIALVLELLELRRQEHHLKGELLEELRLRLH